MTEEEKIWNLATQAYESNPGYALSYQGKEYADKCIKELMLVLPMKMIICSENQ